MIELVSQTLAPDIPNIFTSIAEWGVCMVSILMLRAKNRHGIGKTILLSLPFLVLFIGWHEIARHLSANFFLVRMGFAVGFMFLMFVAITKSSFKESVFRALSCFIIAELVASFEWQINYYFASLFSSVSTLVSLVCMVVIYSILFAVMAVFETRYAKNDMAYVFEKKDIVQITILTVVVFFMSNLSFIFPDTPFSSMNVAEIYYIRTLVDFCGVIFLYLQREHNLSTNAKIEVASIKTIMDKHYEQYCESKENVELLNRTIHDFKHQLFIIKSEPDLSKREEYVESFSTSMNILQARVETGYNVLDTILTTKSMLCNSKNITFTIVADGRLINHIDTMDVCSLIGNVVDNAIESTDRVAEEEKRLIKLALYEHGEFVMLRVENYFSQKLEYTNGKIATTKTDKVSHGYGIKSIEQIAKKYSGTMTINTVDDWFTMLLLLPKR